MAKPYTPKEFSKDSCYTCQKKFERNDAKIPLEIDGWSIFVCDKKECIEEAVFNPIEICGCKMLKKVKYKSLFDVERSDLPIGELAKKLSKKLNNNAKNSSEKIYEETARKIKFMEKYKVEN